MLAPYNRRYFLQIKLENLPKNRELSRKCWYTLLIYNLVYVVCHLREGISFTPISRNQPWWHFVKIFQEWKAIINSVWETFTHIFMQILRWFLRQNPPFKSGYLGRKAQSNLPNNYQQIGKNEEFIQMTNRTTNYQQKFLQVYD